jgi:hypothetical protein
MDSLSMNCSIVYWATLFSLFVLPQDKNKIDDTTKKSNLFFFFIGTNFLVAFLLGLSKKVYLIKLFYSFDRK